MKKTQKEITIHVPVGGNKLLKTTLKRLNENKEVYALWKAINVNAIDRLGMSDHGVVHFQIVANISLRLARILKKSGVKMNVVVDHGLSNDHAEVILLLAGVFHDLGMSISREGHEEFSLILANNLLREILDFMPVQERVIVTSEVLHSIISHRKNGTPYTIEAGILRVADALDMSEGRSRIPYEAGEMGIHAVSAVAIDKVEIRQGKKKPIEIVITMNNSAGIFQVDGLLKGKLKGSKLEDYVAVRAYTKNSSEKKLIKEYTI